MPYAFRGLLRLGQDEELQPLHARLRGSLARALRDVRSLTAEAPRSESALANHSHLADVKRGLEDEDDGVAQAISGRGLGARGPRDAAGCRSIGAGGEAEARRDDLHIIQDIAQNVAGDKAIVESITKPGAEIHGYEPTPLDIVKAQNADLVLWNGMNLERWFEKFFGAVKDVPSAVLTEGIEPIAIADGPYAGQAEPACLDVAGQRARSMSRTSARRWRSSIPPTPRPMRPTRQRYAEQLQGARRADPRHAGEDAGRPAQAGLAARAPSPTWRAAYGCRNSTSGPVNSDEQGTPQQIRKVVDHRRARPRCRPCSAKCTVSDKAMRQVAKETKAQFGGVLYVDSPDARERPSPDLSEDAASECRHDREGVRLGN